MRVTIVPSDGYVSVDGFGLSKIDLTFLPTGIHAVQWYGTRGVVEVKDIETGNMVENRQITELGEFQQAVDAWTIAKQEYDAEVARQMAAVITKPD